MYELVDFEMICSLFLWRDIYGFIQYVTTLAGYALLKWCKPLSKWTKLLNWNFKCQRPQPVLCLGLFSVLAEWGRQENTFFFNACCLLAMKSRADGGALFLGPQLPRLTPNSFTTRALISSGIWKCVRAFLVFENGPRNGGLGHYWHLALGGQGAKCLTISWAVLPSK